MKIQVIILENTHVLGMPHSDSPSLPRHATRNPPLPLAISLFIPLPSQSNRPRRDKALIKRLSCLQSVSDLRR